MDVTLFHVPQADIPETMNTMQDRGSAEERQSQVEQRRPNAIFAGIMSVVELGIVITLVFGIGWGLMRWAETWENRPIVLASEGEIELTAARGTLHGRLEKYPMDLENQTEDFDYFYGRALDEERRNRRIGNWIDDQAYVEWTFLAGDAAVYQVALELASSAESAGSEFRVAVAEQAYAGVVPDTGGEENWEILELGEVQLGSTGPHTLRITPVRMASGNVMNLKRVLLRVQGGSTDREADGTYETPDKSP